jgi:peptide/nickel transport system permease protein
MGFKLVVLWTDWVIFAVLVVVALYALRVRRHANLRNVWSKVLRDAPALCAAVVFGLFAVVTVLDSVHFRRALPAQAAAAAGTPVFYATRTESLLDVVLARQVAMREITYSAPLAAHGFTKVTVEIDGRTERAYPRLQFGGAHLKDPGAERAGDIARRALAGLAVGGAAAAAIAAATAALRARRQRIGFGESLREIAANRTELPLRAALLTVAAVLLTAGPVAALMDHYHVLGTDRTGNDVLYQSLKSIRTAFVIGTLSTLATLPLAVALGIMAGYFRGWVDELIQYLYTVLSSIPNVLLIAACVLMVQVLIDKNPQLFETGVERSDVRLALLCVILGVTGWATLARLLRGETLKLRELEYVQAASAFGVGPWRIMARHIFPNVMHLVLITTVLDFSALVLYEAVLSYVGVGVDPSMNSFGGMINLARSEMSRDPVVWWSFAAAFGFMVTLVLAANLLADGVRDAFDPRARVFRPRLVPLRRAVPGPVGAEAPALRA